MKRIGILAHSAGAAFVSTAVHAGGSSARISVRHRDGYRGDGLARATGRSSTSRRSTNGFAGRGALEAAGADWICPDNTAHMAFEALTEPCRFPDCTSRSRGGRATRSRFKKIGITGTLWTMEGTVYRRFRTAGTFVRDAARVPGRRAADHLRRLVRRGVRPVAGALHRGRAGAEDEGCDAVVLSCTERGDPRRRTLAAADTRQRVSSRAPRSMSRWTNGRCRRGGAAL